MQSNDPPAYPARNKTLVGLSVIVALALVGARTPLLIAAPHLYGEGGEHFRRAAAEGFLGGLFFVHVQAGYFNLVANLGGLLAACLPLELAPYGPTYLAWLVHGIPFLILALARGALFESGTRRAMLFASMLFLPTLSLFSWINTINAQLYLGLACLLVLLDQDFGGKAKRWLQRGVLFLGGLSGVYGALLAPLFWWRARGSRSAEARLHWMLMSALLLLQIVLALSTFLAGLQSSERGQALGIEALGDISTIHVGKVLLGKSALQVAEALRPLGPYVFGLLFLAYLVVVLLRMRSQPRWTHDPRVLLLGALVIWTLAVVLSSFGHRPIGRYAVLPSLTVSFFLISQLCFERRALQSALLLILLLFGLSQGLSTYRSGLPCAENHPHQWRESVEAHALDPTKPLNICPSGWSIKGLDH